MSISVPKRPPSGSGRPQLHSAARRLAGLVGVIGGLLLAGCSTAPRWENTLKIGDLVQSTPVGEVIPEVGPESLPRLAAGAARGGYQVAPQDELALTLWASKDLWAAIAAQGEQVPQTVTVQDDGTISLPLLKPLRVEGLTVNEILPLVVQVYRKALGESVQADGRVVRYRSRSILLDGAFNKPGIAYLGPELRTLGEAISAVGGGLAGEADLTQGALFRDGKRYRIDYQKAQEGAADFGAIELRAGDRVFFPSRNRGVFYVFGEVGTQGVFPIPPRGISLLQALAHAKGPAMVTGDMDAIFLIRGGDKDPKIYHLSMRELIEAGQLPLAADDRLFVPPTRLADWDRSIRQLLPLFSSMVVIDGTIVNPD